MSDAGSRQGREEMKEDLENHVALTAEKSRENLSSTSAHTPGLADGILWERIWSARAGDFSANAAAEQFLASAGFSVGSMQRGDPRGVMFGDYVIAKWRNLNLSERHALHGILAYRNGSARGGDAIVRIFVNAPDEARAALSLAKGGQP